MTLGGGVQSWKTKKISNYCPKRTCITGRFCWRATIFAKCRKNIFSLNSIFSMKQSPSGDATRNFWSNDGYIIFFDIFLTCCPIFKKNTDCGLRAQIPENTRNGTRWSNFLGYGLASEATWHPGLRIEKSNNTDCGLRVDAILNKFHRHVFVFLFVIRKPGIRKSSPLLGDFAA